MQLYFSVENHLLQFISLYDQSGPVPVSHVAYCRATQLVKKAQTTKTLPRPKVFVHETKAFSISLLFTSLLGEEGGMNRVINQEIRRTGVSSPRSGTKP